MAERDRGSLVYMAKLAEQVSIGLGDQIPFILYKRLA
jgi:hypothetical protein